MNNNRTKKNYRKRINGRKRKTEGKKKNIVVNYDVGENLFFSH